MKNKLLGIFFLLVAVALVLKQLNLFFVNIPILLVCMTILFGYGIISGIIKGSLFKTMFCATSLFIVYNDLLQFAPTFNAEKVIFIGGLIYIGLKQLMPKRKKTKKVQVVTDYVSSDTVIFGETNRYIDGDKDNYDLKCIFGEMKVYFNTSQISSQTITLNTVTSFGAMYIFVPSDWEIINNLTIVAAEVSMAKDVTPKTKKLILEGTVAFGELEIIYI